MADDADSVAASRPRAGAEAYWRSLLKWKELLSNISGKYEIIAVDADDDEEEEDSK